MTPPCLSNRRPSSSGLRKLPAMVSSQSDLVCRSGTWRPAGGLTQSSSPGTPAPRALELLLQPGQAPPSVVPSPEDTPYQVRHYFLRLNNTFTLYASTMYLMWHLLIQRGFHGNIPVSVFQTSPRLRRRLLAVAAAAATRHSGDSGLVLQTWAAGGPELGRQWAGSSSAAADLWTAETDQSQSPSDHHLTQRPAHLPLHLTNPRASRITHDCWGRGQTLTNTKHFLEPAAWWVKVLHVYR